MYLNLVGLMEAIEKRGGITLDVMTGMEPVDGYVVAVNGGQRDYPLSLPPLTLAMMAIRFIADNAPLLAVDGFYFGAWVDGTSVVFDVSEVVEDRAEAIAIGEARRQDAIWDIRNKLEIRLK